VHTHCRNMKHVGILLKVAIMGRNMIEWIDNASPSNWCSALFPCPRYGVTTSNTIEIVFSALRKKKQLPTLQLFLFIEQYVLKARYKIFCKVSEVKDVVVDKAAKIIHDVSDLATHLVCHRTDDLSATV
jgi:hypothetical protein